MSIQGRRSSTLTCSCSLAVECLSRLIYDRLEFGIAAQGGKVGKLGSRIGADGEIPRRGRELEVTAQQADRATPITEQRPVAGQYVRPILALT